MRFCGQVAHTANAMQHSPRSGYCILDRYAHLSIAVAGATIWLIAIAHMIDSRTIQSATISEAELQ